MSDTAESIQHETWLPDAIRSKKPVYDGFPPLPREECDLCEKVGEENCGYHGGAIFYCTRCGQFLVHRMNLVPPDEPGGTEIAKGCHCPGRDVGGAFDSQRMHFIGYEATVDPRIKARTPGVTDPRDRLVTACQFCATEDLEDRNEGDYLIQLPCHGGKGVTSNAICEDCRTAHGWSLDNVRGLIA